MVIGELTAINQVPQTYAPLGVFCPEGQHETPADNCVSSGQVDSGMDLDVDGKFGIGVLYWAFIEEHMAAFKFLLERGADLDRRLTEDIVIKRVAKPAKCDAFFSGDSIFSPA